MIDLVTAAENLYWDLVYQPRTSRFASSPSTWQKNAQTIDGKFRRNNGADRRSPSRICSGAASEQMVTTPYIADQTQDRVKRMMTIFRSRAAARRTQSIDAPRKPSGDDVMSLRGVQYAPSRPELRAIDLQIQNGDLALKYNRTNCCRR
jgi:hypothetical protein